MIDIQKNMPLIKHQTQDDSGKRTISKEFHDYMIKEIVNKISRLIEDNNLRKTIERNNLDKARDLFSFERRNKIMRKIYEEAIK